MTRKYGLIGGDWNWVGCAEDRFHLTAKPFRDESVMMGVAKEFRRIVDDFSLFEHKATDGCMTHLNKNQTFIARNTRIYLRDPDRRSHLLPRASGVTDRSDDPDDSSGPPSFASDSDSSDDEEPAADYRVTDYWTMRLVVLV